MKKRSSYIILILLACVIAFSSCGAKKGSRNSSKKYGCPSAISVEHVLNLLK